MVDLGKAEDLTGYKFNRLTVTEPVGRTPNGTIRWSCSCECGGSTIVSSVQLRNGGVKSCKCLRAESGQKNRTHGMSKTPTYRTWRSMLNRCTNPNSPDYAIYGGRGITVCERWKSFEAFLEDMGERPAGKTLERERGSQGYRPENCRWATPLEQAQNRQFRMKITHKELLKLGALALARNLALHRGDKTSVARLDADLAALGLIIFSSNPLERIR